MYMIMRIYNNRPHYVCSYATMEEAVDALNKYRKYDYSDDKYEIWTSYFEQ